MIVSEDFVRKNLKYLFLFAISALVFQVFISCGVKYVGYGVVLWDGGKLNVKTGDLLKIIQKSKKRNTYLVEMPGGEKEEIPAGYIEYFNTEEDAQKFLNSYSSRLYRYGFAEVRGLPIREKASTASRIIYRLRKGQVVKIISRSETEETVESYKAYWYTVLTSDGYRGYCFGYFLRIFDTKGNPVVKVKELMKEDPVLTSFLNTTWRPEYFLSMIRDGRIDLDKFRTDIGLFPDPDNKTITLVTDKYRLDFEYSGVERIGNNRYYFKGTDLRVIVYSKKRVTISYKVNNKNVSAGYVVIDRDINDIIAEETARRDALFNDFVKNGNRLVSKFYGIITLNNDKSFTWIGNEKLIGSIIPRYVTNGGIVEFKYYVEGRLKGLYNGVISLKFNRKGGSDKPVEINFLFKFLSNGVRFTYTDRDAIKNLEVRTISIPPLNIFFKFEKALSSANSGSNNDSNNRDQTRGTPPG